MVKDLLRRIRIARLKRKARRHWRAIERDFNDYDCGRGMINYITGGRLERNERAYSETMGELRRLDPEAPR